MTVFLIQSALSFIASDAVGQQPKPESPQVTIVHNPNLPAVELEMVQFGSPGKIAKTQRFTGPVCKLEAVDREVEFYIRAKHPIFYQWGEWFSAHGATSIPGMNGVLGVRFKKITPTFDVQVRPLDPVCTWKGTTRRIGQALVAISMQSDHKAALTAWTKTTDAKLAGELAKLVCEGRTRQGHWGGFQNKDWVVVVPSTADQVHPDLRGLGESELTAHFVQMLGTIRTNISGTRDGDTVQKLLDKLSSL